jgi:hypothetical protein
VSLSCRRPHISLGGGTSRRSLFKDTGIFRPNRDTPLTIQYTVTYDTAGLRWRQLEADIRQSTARVLPVGRRLRKIRYRSTAIKIFPQLKLPPSPTLSPTKTPKDGTKIGETTFYSSSKAFVGGGYEVFLKYNLPRLMTIAKGRAANSKSWPKAISHRVPRHGREEGAACGPGKIVCVARASRP